MPLVQLVKDLCEEHGETLASLERKMDFGNGTIRKWDKATPSGDKLAKVADYFDVSIDYLLGRTNPPQTIFPTQGLEDHLSQCNANPDIIMIARAGKKMTNSQAENLRKYAQYMFPEAFADDT